MTTLEPRFLRRQLDIGHPLRRRYSLHGFEHHPSRVLQEHSKGRHRLGELYDEIEHNDTYFFGLLDRRAKAVGALPRLVVAADGKSTSGRGADLCRFSLGDTDLEELRPHLKHLAAGLQEWRRLGIGRAIAFLEVEWADVQRGRWAGMIVPVALHQRDMWHFAFDQDDRLHYRPTSGGDPQAVPAGKILEYRSVGGAGWPNSSLMDRLFWAYQLTTDTTTSWAIFNEIFAMPVRITEYEKTGDALKDEELESEALKIAEAVQEEFAVAIPKGFVLRFLETARSGNAEYHTFLSWINRAKALAVNGEINTAGLRPGTGAFASDQVADAIRRETVEFDARVESEALSTLCEWIVRANFPPTVDAPTVIIDTADAEDIEVRQQALKDTLALTDQPIAAAVWGRAFRNRRVRPGESMVGRANASAPTPDAPPPASSPATDDDAAQPIEDAA